MVAGRFPPTPQAAVTTPATSESPTRGWRSHVAHDARPTIKIDSSSCAIRAMVACWPQRKAVSSAAGARLCWWSTATSSLIRAAESPYRMFPAGPSPFLMARRSAVWVTGVLRYSVSPRYRRLSALRRGSSRKCPVPGPTSLMSRSHKRTTCVARTCSRRLAAGASRCHLDDSPP
jgi:hypothetical protein